MMIVGYLVDGKFICYACMRGTEMSASDRTPIRVGPENLGIYSQRCGKCKTLAHEGRVETELFPTSEKEAFNWSMMSNLVQRFDDAFLQRDDEAAASAKRRIYEEILRAVMTNKLEDQELIWKQLQRVMETENRW